MNEGLTVFLGGAGMNGNYQVDMVESLRRAGINNPVFGNYSGWFKELDKKIPASLDTLGDASAILRLSTRCQSSRLKCGAARVRGIFTMQ